MKGSYKVAAFVLISVFYLVVDSSVSHAELIEPTRMLSGEQDGPGRLTVLSEPPDLKIALDGSSLGKTPAFLVEVEAGIHTLRVNNLETEIYVESGKTLKISLHKDEFILIPVAERETNRQLEIEEKTVSGRPHAERPRNPVKLQTEADRRKAIERFQQFTDGSQEYF